LLDRYTKQTVMQTSDKQALVQLYEYLGRKSRWPGSSLGNNVAEVLWEYHHQ